MHIYEISGSLLVDGKTFLDQYKQVHICSFSVVFNIVNIFEKGFGNGQLWKQFERSKRLEHNHPNRVLVDKWSQNQRLKNTHSILDTVVDLQEKHHLPERREPLNRVPPNLPPHLNILKLQVPLAVKIPKPASNIGQYLFQVLDEIS